MIVIYNKHTKKVESVTGYREGIIPMEMIDSMMPKLGKEEEYLIVKNLQDIKSIWQAVDTKGEINLIFGEDGSIEKIEAIEGDYRLPPEPDPIEQIRLEQAQANAELFELVLMLTQGV